MIYYNSMPIVFINMYDRQQLLAGFVSKNLDLIENNF